MTLGRLSCLCRPSLPHCIGKRSSAHSQKLLRLHGGPFSVTGQRGFGADSASFPPRKRAEGLDLRATGGREEEALEGDSGTPGGVSGGQNGSARRLARAETRRAASRRGRRALQGEPCHCPSSHPGDKGGPSQGWKLGLSGLRLEVRGGRSRGGPP